MATRSWREWARRWYLDAQTGVLPLEERLQPVVIADDVSSMMLPPLVACWGMYSNVGAVAAQFSTWIVQPRTRPARIVSCSINVQAYYGVTDGDASAIAAAIAPNKTQGPVGAVADAIARGGTTVTDLTATVNPPATNGLYANTLDLLVIPGQFFWIQMATVNIGGELERLTWVEIPHDDYLSSLPR